MFHGVGTENEAVTWGRLIGEASRARRGNIVKLVTYDVVERGEDLEESVR